MVAHRLLAGYRRALRLSIILMIVAMLAIMGLQIVFRYGLNSSLIWAEAMCRYLLIWVSFLACADAYERGEIAAVTILRDALPRRAGLVLAMLINTAGIVLLVLLVIYGLRYAQMVGRQPIPAFSFLFGDLFGSAAPPAPSTFWVYAGLPVGMALLAGRLVIDLVIFGAMMVRGGYARDLRPPAGLEAGQ